MPVVHFHLLARQDDAERHAELLRQASTLYADILEAPIERVRAFIVPYTAEQLAVAGELADETSQQAPYFTAVVLAGRPVEQRQRLLAGFTDLLVDTLNVPRQPVRGRIIEVEPENWGIGGEPASTRRAGEVAARAHSA